MKKPVNPVAAGGKQPPEWFAPCHAEYNAVTKERKKERKALFSRIHAFISQYLRPD